jgi:hypothetical protein
MENTIADSETTESVISILNEEGVDQEHLDAMETLTVEDARRTAYSLLEELEAPTISE